jgi:TonB family protein
MPHCQKRKPPMRVIPSTLLVCLCAASAALAEVPPGNERTQAGSEPPMLEKKSCATLQYPIASLRAEETGRVVVQVTVGAEGQARFPRIIRSSGFPRLDDASVAYVLTCRFDRAGSGDAAADVNVIVPIEWRIESPQPPAPAPLGEP